MGHADMTLVYKGPAVEVGAIVRDLAPALLAFGDSVETPNRFANGDKAAARVQVKTVGAGSCAIAREVAVGAPAAKPGS